MLKSIASVNCTPHGHKADLKSKQNHHKM